MIDWLYRHPWALYLVGYGSAAFFCYGWLLAAITYAEWYARDHTIGPIW